MKWVLLSISIWNGGDYTFFPLGTYDTEKMCSENLKPPMSAGQTTNSDPLFQEQYTTSICLPEPTWIAFAMNWKGSWPK
jgi:hypothetical protein